MDTASTSTSASSQNHEKSENERVRRESLPKRKVCQNLKN